MAEIYKNQKKIILPITKREFFLAGLLLYWGEGTKSRTDCLSMSNSDPSVIRFFIYWLNKNLSVHKKKMKIYLHLYSNMDIKKESLFWSEKLDIPLHQFGKPYIKKSSSLRINHKGGFGHGTCNLTIGNARLSEKIFMSLKVISDRY